MDNLPNTPGRQYIADGGVTMKHFLPILALFLSQTVSVGLAVADAEEGQYWVKIRAENREQRSEVAATGASIETVSPDYVVAYATKEELAVIKERFDVLTSFLMTHEMKDFPSKDSKFHNYSELRTKLETLAKENADIVEVKPIGASLEKRDLLSVRISTDLSQSSKKPAIIFLGTHHAREHLSTEMPLMLAEYLVAEYKKGTERIVKLLEGREIHIIPLVNPDGSEYDISTGVYKTWRKNTRAENGNMFGVDLNRNYGYMWGGGGASPSKNSETYRGESAFSEPETQAVKAYIEKNKNINILLTFHTFSELILYPWGHTYNPISDEPAKMVHETMAKTMAKWNGYTPQQSSGLYIASGDTTDWAYGVHKIISFTFELDPKSSGLGGFYPGQAKIPVVFQKNIEPCLYLIDYADDPYRVLNRSGDYGFVSGLLN